MMRMIVYKNEININKKKLLYENSFLAFCVIL